MVFQTLPTLQKAVRLADLVAGILALAIYGYGLFWLYRHNEGFVSGSLKTVWRYHLPVVLLCTVSVVWLSSPKARWRLFGSVLHLAAAIGYAVLLFSMGPISLKFSLFLIWLVAVSTWWGRSLFSASCQSTIKLGTNSRGLAGCLVDSLDRCRHCASACLCLLPAKCPMDVVCDLSRQKGR